jgi:8-oxo-dGTP diphosphatase
LDRQGNKFIFTTTDTEMKKIEVVAAVIMNENGDIYCVQRGENSKEYLSKKWEFPGGKIESEETEIAALVREINEELQVKVIPIEKFLIVEHTYPDFQLTMHTYICKIKNGSPVIGEHINEKWLNKNQLLHLDWAAADIPIVEYLIKTP